MLHVEYQYCAGTGCLHLQGRSVSSTLEMEETGSTKMLTPIYQTILHHILGDNVLDAHKHENLKLSQFAYTIQYCHAHL